MRQVNQRGMLVDQPSSMLNAARGVASHVRHRTASWGCARLAAECCSHPHPSRVAAQLRASFPHRAQCSHARHVLTTFAALSTRETPTLLDPGDYEAGQIQASANFLGRLFTLADMMSRSFLYHMLAVAGLGGPRPCSQTSWHVYRQYWSKGPASPGRWMSPW